MNYDAPKTAGFTLRSPTFAHEERIPSKYTCDGENLIPPLAIFGTPQGTVSLALIMDDPDSPSGTWDHWVIFNLPPDTERIGEGDMPRGVSGVNTWGKLGYGGPCPGSGEHRYLFKLYALNTLLPLAEGASKEEVLSAMDGHVVESTTLMGRYERGE